MRSKAYRSTGVNDVDVSKVIAGKDGRAAWFGMDVGKYHILGVTCWGDRQFERPWRVDNPGQIPLLVDKLKELATGRSLVLALEPSGSYGDALRQAASAAGLEVHRVSTKAAHDHAEVFDGVPSQHDAKDAAVVADLALSGKSVRWAFDAGSDLEQELAYWVDRLDGWRRMLQIWAGRLEGLLGRHWPQATQLLKVQSTTLLKCLIQYGSPQALAEDPQARARLARWGRSYLSSQRIDELLASARSGLGVKTGPWDQRRLGEYAQEAFDARAQVRACQRELARLSAKEPTIQRMGQVVGKATACVLWVLLGDPRQYSCAAAYVKAMGLNLAERSSGIWRGRLKISKRGFGAVRYWMYLAAMRRVRPGGGARAWYLNKKQQDGQRGGKGLVGVMRRLATALWHVGQGSVFDEHRLFGGARVKEKGR
jgi:transposase